MSEPCDGPGPGAGQGRDLGDVPGFVPNCEDEERDAGHVKDAMHRDKEMEKDEDELVSRGRCRLEQQYVLFVDL